MRIEFFRNSNSILPKFAFIAFLLASFSETPFYDNFATFSAESVERYGIEIGLVEFDTVIVMNNEGTWLSKMNRKSDNIVAKWDKSDL